MKLATSAEVARIKSRPGPDSNPRPPAPKSCLLTTRTPVQMFYDAFLQVQRAPRVLRLPVVEGSSSASSRAGRAGASSLRIRLSPSGEIVFSSALQCHCARRVALTFGEFVGASRRCSVFVRRRLQGVDFHCRVCLDARRGAQVHTGPLGRRWRCASCHASW